MKEAHEVDDFALMEQLDKEPKNAKHERSNWDGVSILGKQPFGPIVENQRMYQTFDKLKAFSRSLNLKSERKQEMSQPATPIGSEAHQPTRVLSDVTNLSTPDPTCRDRHNSLPARLPASV